MTHWRAREIWRQERSRLLPEVERHGVATMTVAFVRHRYFDNTMGREVVEIRCGDELIERLSP